ncbi:MAG: DMT family transporter [Candidatus Ornithospirochaeta sp.]|nr:DMT family transporter [Candidatus Ornithospirochaeta sp.]
MIGKKQKAILLIIASAFFFSILNMFIRLAGDLPSIQKSFFRNAIASVFAGILLVKERNSINVRKNDVPILIARSVLGTIGILGNFYAVDHLILADATMLNKMSPFFAILFSLIFLKEGVSLFQALMVVGAFIGSLFIIKPSFSNANLLASLVGVAGGLGAGGAYTCVRALGKRNVSRTLIVLFFSLFSCMVTLPAFIFDYHPMTGMQLLYLILAGLSAAGGQFSITAAYAYAPARDISVYDYSQILFSAVIGFFVFADQPDGWSVLGYFVIIAMAILMFLHDQKAADK